MKTLKKTLCMVLAVVMVVGVLILPASADDAADKAKAQKDAYDTLTLYGIMHGRDGGAAALDENVRRDEVATIAYRILTGDTSEDGKMAGNYKAAAKNFTDVATTNWAAGFIGYTAESKIFSGRAGNAFDPTANVRGDELVKVMLRCLGYGAEDEYTGEGWNTRALYTAQEIGMLKGIDEQMDQPITRGAVAQIVANAIKLPMAVYYNGTYSSYRDVSGRPVAPNTPGATPNPALVEYNTNKGDVKYDKWGAPYYEYTPTISFNHVYGAEAKELDKVTEKLAPKGEYFVATTECDICEDGGIEKTASLVEYINGTKQAANHDIQATDTVGTVGAQGQWTRTFDVDGKDGIDLVVRVDTLLAKVVEVTKEEKDPAGHIKVAATMGLYVYTTTDNDPSNDTTANYVVAGNDYKKGDFILLRAVATNATTLSVDKDSKLGAYYEIIGAAPQFPGTQTTIWYNTASHVIDGKTYPDNNRFHLDVAQTTGGNYVWFTDGNGNIIGSVEAEAAPASYAILKNMIWKTGNPGHAEATLLYMDGTEATVTVASIDGDDGKAAYAKSTAAKDAVPSATDGVTKEVSFSNGDKKAYVSDEGSFNGLYNGYALYAVTVKSNGSVKLDIANDKDEDIVSWINDGTLKAKNIIIKDGTIYASDNTVFIYKNVDGSKITYTRVVGKDNITGMTDANLFYVDTNGDKVAEYVYVVDGDDSTTPDHLVAALSGKYSYGLYDGDQAWTLDKAFVGGKEVATGTIYADKEDHIKTLAQHVGELYWVDYTSGAVKDENPTAVDTTGHKLDATGAPSSYDTDDAVYRLADDVTISVSGGIISINKIGSTKTNIVMAASDLKTVYGADKAALADVEWSKVNAYAVVKKGVVTDLYIFAKPDQANNPSGGTPSTIKLDGDFTVELTTDGVTAKFKVHDDSATAAKAAKWKAVTKIEQLFATGYTEVTTNTTTIDMSNKTDYSSDGVSVYDGTLFDGSNYRVTCSLYADDKLVGTATATGIPTTP